MTQPQRTFWYEVYKNAHGQWRGRFYIEQERRPVWGHTSKRPCEARRRVRHTPKLAFRGPACLP